MSKIIACIDGSAYADSVCYFSAWVHEKTGCPISLLHVVAPHSEMKAQANLSGHIGLEAKASLLEELVKLDEEHGRLELRRGQLMLEHSREELAAKGFMQPEIMHLRGSLVDTIAELESQTELIVMGKRGEQHHTAPEHLGSNLERVARTLSKPLLVATMNTRPIKKYAIAYNGSPSADKAVEFAARNPLLEGLECHLLNVGNATPETQEMMHKAKQRLKACGVQVHASFIAGQAVDLLISEYITSQSMDLLLIGAYSHSKIHNLVLGSTTTALIHRSEVPLLLFR